jgi:hypothetical protein
MMAARCKVRPETNHSKTSPRDLAEPTELGAPEEMPPIVQQKCLGSSEADNDAGHRIDHDSAYRNETRQLHQSLLRA